MRFLYAAAALFASLALCQQNNAISIPAGQSSLDVTAGQPTTITWTNPSPGTVTIKLQQSGANITPDSGITLASNVPASDGTYTFTVQPDQVNTFQYTIEIIDDTNSSNINFSPNFGITGATKTTTDTASSGSSGSMTSTATDSTATGSTATDSTATTTSGSSSTSASSSKSSGASDTSSSAMASQTTSAPSSSGNGAAGLKVQGGLVAAVAVAIAIL